MKYLVACVMVVVCLFAANAVAQTKPTVPGKIEANVSVDVGPNVTALVESGGEKIVKVAEVLAKQLGTTTEKVFPYYVKQQYVEGWVSLIAWSAFLLVAFSFGVTFIRLGIKEGRSNPGKETSAEVAGWIIGVISLIVFGVAIIVGVIYISGWIAQIANPEYGAIRQMVSDASALVGR